MEKGCILKIKHPFSSIDGACKVGEMIIVEKVSIYNNDVGYNSKTEGYTTFMSDINKLYETPIFKGVMIKNAPKRFNISRLAEKSNGLKLDINSILKL